MIARNIFMVECEEVKYPQSCEKEEVAKVLKL